MADSLRVAADVLRQEGILWNSEMESRNFS